MWAFLLSIPTLLRVVDQLISLGFALYKGIKDAETRREQRERAKQITEAVHKAIDTKDTTDLENVLNAHTSSAH